MQNYMFPFDSNLIKRIKQQYPTPFYLFDEQGIIDQVAALKRAFSWNRGFREYFAVKATPNPAILQLLSALGCGANCTSEAELILCNRLGITHEQLMFTSNNTPEEEFQLAKQLGAVITLDAAEHVEYLLNCVGVPETVCLRINPGTAGDITGNLRDSRFGMTKPQLIDSIRKLALRGTKQFGIHAMLASNSLDALYYPVLAQMLFSLVVEIRRTLGVTIAFVDLGGGIGIPYRPQEEPINILSVGAAIKACYDTILTPEGIDLAIYTELGRFLTGPCAFLVTTVLHKKETYKKYLGVDTVMCDAQQPALSEAYHQITVVGKEMLPASEMYDITGFTCAGNDRLAVDRRMPPVSIGDLLVVHDVGAYGYFTGSNLNGKLRAKELLLRADGSVEMIRRVQTLKDLFSTLDIYPEFRQ